MGQKRYFFPVGHELSTAQLSRFSWTDMQTRSIYDPNFRAPEDPKFNWRKYLELQFNDKKVEAQVSRTLDQIASTPEGQQIIRQAYAMQNYRMRTGDIGDDTGKKARPRGYDDKLFIGDQTNAAQSLFIPSFNMIMVYEPEISGHSLPGRDGRYYHLSMPGVLFHELCHAADGLSLASRQRYLGEVKGPELRAEERAIFAAARVAGTDPNDSPRANEWWEKRGSISEYPAILATNVFMQKYYGEKPQLLRHDRNRENTPENEARGLTLDQPHLPAGIVYSRMPFPDGAPPPPPTPPRKPSPPLRTYGFPVF